MANIQYYDVIYRPVITEQSMNDMADKVYTFYVHPDANKVMIREAVERINDMFGLDISVDFRDDYRQTDDENMIGDESSGNEGKPTAMVEDLRTR